MKDAEARRAIQRINRNGIELRECPNCGHRTPQMPVGFMRGEFGFTESSQGYDCLTCGCHISMGVTTNIRNRASRSILDRALDCCERMATATETTLARLEKAEGEIAALKAAAAKPKTKPEDAA